MEKSLKGLCCCLRLLLCLPSRAAAVGKASTIGETEAGEVTAEGGEHHPIAAHAGGEGKRWVLRVLTPTAGAGRSAAGSEEGPRAAGTSLCTPSFSGAAYLGSSPTLLWGRLLLGSSS